MAHLPQMLNESELIETIAENTGLRKEDIGKVLKTLEEYIGTNIKEQFVALTEVVRTIISTLDLDRVLHLVVEKVVRVMGANASSIRLLDPTRRYLIIMAAHGLSEAYIQKGPVEVEKSGVDREVFEGKLILISDASKDPRFQYPDDARREGIASVLCAPLQAHGTVIGVLRVYTSTVREFLPDEIAFLSAIGDIAAIAIENARIYEKLARKLENAGADVVK